MRVWDSLESLLVFVVVGAVGLFVAYLGYRIRYRRDVHLVAGYRGRRAVDEAELARVVGRATLAVAGVTAVAGAVYPFVASKLSYWTAYTLAVLGLAGYSVFATRRLVEDPERGTR